MYTGVKKSSAGCHILVVRLGAMGDIIHTLPAVASLKHSFPGCDLTWAVEPQWVSLLEGNPFIDRLILLDRTRLSALAGNWQKLRAGHFDFAVDFQGLVKSALVASVARPDRIFGFHRSQLREKFAGIFYSNQSLSHAGHIVDRNLDLAAAAGAGSVLKSFPLPPGKPEGALPQGDFVLASPFAGWVSKQWPPEFYGRLAARLQRETGVPLVLNGPPEALQSLAAMGGATPHVSSIAGLIHATRCAAAVVGVDSGPLHLAAAIGKPGVAIFGPTDPQRNGPYGDTFTVLRSARAATSYRRGSVIDESMRDISPDAVFDALTQHLIRQSKSAGCHV